MSWRNDQVSELETQELLRLARESLVADGDYVEFGCYRGDTSLLLAEMLQKHNMVVEKPVENSKKLWLYDSFEGLPTKTEKDASALGGNFVKGALAVSKREVKARFLRAGLPVPVLKKAWFEELTWADLPEKIAWAFLDGDLYNSIKTSLALVTPRMAQGGVIIVHDYANAALPGVARALDEWKQKMPKLETVIFQSMAVIRGF